MGGHAHGERNREYARFAHGEAQVLCASVILDEGEDIPEIDTVVLAEGVKDTKSLIQSARTATNAGGPGEVWVVDFAITCHPVLLNHAMSRVRECEAQGWDVRLVDDFDPAHPALPFADVPAIASGSMPCSRFHKQLVYGCGALAAPGRFGGCRRPTRAQTGPGGAEDR